MGLQSFTTFQTLLENGHYIKKMGFCTDAGAINRFRARIKLVDAFQGVQLEGYNQQTIRGYSALFKVFLTHSALECFINILGVNDTVYGMDEILQPYNPEEILCVFRERDRGNKLYQFLDEHMSSKRLRKALQECKQGNCSNVAIVSASIRHIFAHGELTPHANAMNPNSAYSIGTAVSEFLMHVMNCEFTKTINVYCALHGIDPTETSTFKRRRTKSFQLQDLMQAEEVEDLRS